MTAPKFFAALLLGCASIVLLSCSREIAPDSLSPGAGGIVLKQG